MKKFSVLLIVFLFCGVCPAEEVVPLPDLLNPESLHVDDSQLYITEGTSVYIYDQKTFRLVSKFGKDGEGPQEFKILPFLPLFINVTEKHIVVNSFGKVSRFDKKGRWIDEEKVKGGYIFYIMPAGPYLVGQAGIQENKSRYLTINIYDSKLEKRKEITRVLDDFKGPGNGYDVLEKRFRHQVMGNRILVCQGNRFSIDKYDLNGSKISSITLEEYDRVPMTSNDREKITDYLENGSRTKSFFPLLKPLRFPSHFPAVMNLFVANNKLYVMTWRRKNQETEFFIFDSEGKLVKHTFLPLVFQNAIEPAPFAIDNDRFFQLAENEETGDWELHINRIQ